MILVAGGTGRLGSSLAQLLRARGEQVRILSRSATAAVSPGCELYVGDVRDPKSLRSAVTGVDAVVSAVHGFTGKRGAGPDEIDHLGNVNLAKAAVDSDVRRFVLISVYDARADNPMELHRAKHAAESQLMSTGLDWTIIRPSAFIETWLEVITNQPGRPALVFGSARNPINFVSVLDVVSAVDGALRSPATIRQVIDVTGPQNLTMFDMAHACGAQHIRRIPRVGLRIMGQLARPFSAQFARQARTALAMDTTDMTAEADVVGEPFTSARRSLADVLSSQRQAATARGFAS